MSFFVWATSAMVISMAVSGVVAALSGSFIIGTTLGIGASLIWLWSTGEIFLKDN